MTTKTKAVTTILETAPTVIETAKTLKITDEASLTSAVDILSQLSKKAKEIKAEREEITKPIKEGLDKVTARYKPTEDALKALIDSIRGQMTAYQTQQARIEADAKKKIDDKIASGKMKLETGLAKREAVESAPTKIASSAGKVSFREVECFEVIDIKKIPHTYLLPNETEIRNAMKAGIKIDGIRYYTEQRPINRTN